MIVHDREYQDINKQGTLKVMALPALKAISSGLGVQCSELSFLYREESWAYLSLDLQVVLHYLFHTVSHFFLVKARGISVSKDDMYNNKQLLDEVFAIFGIIKVEVTVMNLLHFQMPATLLLEIMHCARNLQIIH